MKIWFLLGICFVVSLNASNQDRLHILKQDYSKLFEDVREIARKAVKNNLFQIRNDLDFLKEGNSLLQKKLKDTRL